VTIHRLPGTPLTGRVLLNELLDENDDAELASVVVVSADAEDRVSVSHSRMTLERLSFMALVLLARAQELAAGGRTQDVVAPPDNSGSDR
jgi:hypothetical protein